MEWVTIGEMSVDELVDYCWSIYQNPKTRFYPIMDNREDIRKVLNGAVRDETLLILRDGDDYAILPLIVDCEGKYLQAVGGIACERKYLEFAEMFYKYIRQKYKGYQFFIGYPSSNRDAIDFLGQEGFQCVDKLIRYERILSDHDKFTSSTFTEDLKRDGEEAFSDYHNRLYPDAYWNGTLILANRDKWTIRTIDVSPITGSVCAMNYQKQNRKYAEIYFLDSDNANAMLLNDVLWSLSISGVEKVIYLVEEIELDKIYDVETLGFERIDDYRGYSIQI